MTGAPGAVLDASALLAYVRDETGAAQVETVLRQGAAISAVNWSEVLSKLSDAGLDPRAISKRLLDETAIGSVLAIWPFDESLALEAALLRNQTRPLGLSLADRACIALGAFLRVPVFTSDRTWINVKSNTAIRTIR